MAHRKLRKKPAKVFGFKKADTGPCVMCRREIWKHRRCEVCFTFVWCREVAAGALIFRHTRCKRAEVV